MQITTLINRHDFALAIDIIAAKGRLYPIVIGYYVVSFYELLKDTQQHANAIDQFESCTRVLCTLEHG